MNWPAGSLRTRLTVAFAIAMALVLLGLGIFIYLQLASELLQGVDRGLAGRADALSAEVTLGRAAPLGEHRFADPDEAFAQLLDRSGRILDASPAVASLPLLSPGAAGALAGPRLSTRSMGPGADDARLLSVPAQIEGRPGIVVVGATLGDRADALNELLVIFAIGGPAALALSSAAGWVLAGAALRPVERLRRRAAEISDTDPAARLPVPGTGDELTRLATTLNQLLSRQQQAREREHRFVDDASHELRTPLAILKAELDLALSRPRSRAELDAVLHTAAGETDRLVRLAQDLLVMARFRAGRLPLHLQEVRLSEFLQQCAAGVRARTETGRPARIRVLAPEQVVVLDGERIRRALGNLLDNAVRHGSEPVTLSARVPAGGGVVFDVEDCGAGIAPGMLESVFEPFVRGQSGGGCGLGLAIVRAVTQAHGGSVDASNLATGGTRVRLRLAPQQPGCSEPAPADL